MALCYGVMRALPILLVLLTLVSSGPLGAQKADPGRVVATANKLAVQEGELEALLLERYAMGTDGRELAKVLLSAKLIKKLAKKRGHSVSKNELDRRFDQLDREIRAQGSAKGLLGQLEEQGMSVPDFRDILAVAMLQETMTREDKDINALLPVTGPMQESWLAGQFMEQGVEWPTPPFAEGLVAKSRTGLKVTVEEFTDLLRERLPRVDVEESAWHLILLKGLESRLADVNAETKSRALDQEIERRRAKHALAYPKISFEQRLGASGRTLESFRQEPSTKIAALARLWVDRTYGDEGLKAAFEKDRAYFEGRFGRAVRANLLFLLATADPKGNEFIKRSYEEAERELERMLDAVGNTDDFRAIAKANSEEQNTRTTGGELGFVTRDDPRVAAEIRRELFHFLDSGGKVPPTGVAIGPTRFGSGVAILWVSSIRPTPEWDVMVEHVHNHLRAGLLDSIAKRTEIQLH